jgi:hypothetical protein
VEVIPGEQTKLEDATVQATDRQFEVPYGYMQTIALVVKDQGGNIIIDPQLSVTEYVTPDNSDAKLIYATNKSETTNDIKIGQESNGAFYDAQIRSLDPNKRSMDIQTKQDAVVKSGNTNLFMVQENRIRMDDSNRNITFTQGRVRKF